jgi:hypothetical protein
LKSYGLYEDAGGYYYNQRGHQEKYLRGTVSANGFSSSSGYWYYLLPNGNFYEQKPPYTSPTLSGVLVATLGVAYYNNPTLLTGATDTPVPVKLGLSGNQLTITPNSGYAGTFVVIATVADTAGHSATKSFRTTVQADTPPSLASIPNQTIPGGTASKTLTLIGTDPDLGPYGQAPQTLTFSAQTQTPVDVTLGIVGNELTITPGSGFTGTFVVIVSVNDGIDTTQRAFKVSVS